MKKTMGKTYNLNEIISQEKYETRRIANGIYDTEDIEVLFIEADYCYNTDRKKQIDTFIKKHPTFVYARPYEGNTTIFFSDLPKKEIATNIIMLHRGAVVITKKMIVIADLN